MTDPPPTTMREVYRRFCEGELPLERAADLLRQHARLWKTQAGSLKLDMAPGREREKSAQLLNAAIQPAVARFLAGEVSSDATARQVAPLVFPVGVFALNFSMRSEVGATERMARFGELVQKLVEMAEAAESG